MDNQEIILQTATETGKTYKYSERMCTASNCYLPPPRLAACISSDVEVLVAYTTDVIDMDLPSLDRHNYHFEFTGNAQPFMHALDWSVLV